MQSPRGVQRTARANHAPFSPAAFTLPELLVVVLLVALIAAGMGGVFSSQNRAYVQQDLHVAMEENLRVAMSTVADTLRQAGCGVPPSHLGSWITWASDFTDGPVVVADGGGGPDVLSVAACTPSLATLTVAAAAGSTNITIASSVAGKSLDQLFNTADKSLIWIGDGDYALVRALSGDTFTIDTDPITSGNQGLLRTHAVGTPISRVDVSTFTIGDDETAAQPALFLDKHRGGTVSPAAEGITDLKVTTLTPGRQYQLMLTGRSEREDPVTGAFFTRSLVSNITVRN